MCYSEKKNCHFGNTCYLWYIFFFYEPCRRVACDITDILRRGNFVTYILAVSFYSFITLHYVFHRNARAPYQLPLKMDPIVGDKCCTGEFDVAMSRCHILSLFHFSPTKHVLYLRTEAIYVTQSVIGLFPVCSRGKHC